MTLWHLFHAISFGTPLAGALTIGFKTGSILGVLIALVCGLGFALLSFWGVYEASWIWFCRTEKMKSEIAQNISICFLHFAILFSAFLFGGLSIETTKLLIQWIL